MKIDIVVRSELTGDDSCSALGFTAKSFSPVLALCRQLVEAGHDPSMPLEAWRGDVLCLRVRSIGEAAGLEVAANGVGFRRRREADAASLMRLTEVPGPRLVLSEQGQRGGRGHAVDEGAATRH